MNGTGGCRVNDGNDSFKQAVFIIPNKLYNCVLHT